MALAVLQKLSSSAWLGLAAVVLFVLSAPVFGYPVCTGLDCSGGFGLNYFFAHHIQLGRDILYSYGPFGFLNGALPLGNNLLYSVAIQSIGKILFLYTLLRLAWIHTGKIWQRWVAIGCVIFTAFYIDFILMLIFWTPLALLLGRETGKSRWYGLACTVAAFGLCFKSVTGVTTFAALFMFFLFEYALQGDWREPIRYMLLTLGMTALFWFFAYGNFEGLVPYVLSLPEFAQGQSSAMTQNPPNNWWALGLMFVALLGLPLLFRPVGQWLQVKVDTDSSVAGSRSGVVASNQAVVRFWLVLVLPTYLFWKYAFTRQDHSIFFFNFLILYFVLLVAYTKRLNWKMVLIIALTFTGMLVNMNLSGYNHIKLTNLKVNSRGLQHVAEVLDWKRYQARLLQESEEALAARRLSPALLKRLNGRTVDFYPWETTYAQANPKLIWAPRPVYQSHMTFRPYFDEKNAHFLNHPAGPQFILWERDHRGGKMGSIDYRYLLNDDPLTIQAILTQFRPVAEDAQVVVFERSGQGMLKPSVDLQKTQARWGEWIVVPEVQPFPDHRVKPMRLQRTILLPDQSNGLLRAKVTATPMMLAKIKRAVYKENDAWMEYRLADGSIKKHRLVLDNMISGLAVAPYVTEMTIHWKTLPVEAIRLTHSPSDPYEPELAIQWEWLARN